MERWIWITDGSYSVSDIEDYIEYIIKNMKHSQWLHLFAVTPIESIID